MNCRDVESALPLYCGGELSRWLRFRVRRHLAVCSGCRTALAELNVTRAVVREALESVPVPQSADSLWEEVVRRLPAGGAAPDVADEPGASSASGGRRRRIVLIPVAVVVAALLLVVVLPTDDVDNTLDTDVAGPEADVVFPPVVESIDGPGTKIMDFATDNPGVTIAWIIEPSSNDE